MSNSRYSFFLTSFVAYMSQNIITFAPDSSQSVGTRRVAKDIVGQRPSSPSQGWSRKGRFQNVIFYIQNFATFGLPEDKRNEAFMLGVLYPDVWQP